MQKQCLDILDIHLISSKSNEERKKFTSTLMTVENSRLLTLKPHEYQLMNKSLTGSSSKSESV